jgi:hypothetical protein
MSESRVQSDDPNAVHWSPTPRLITLCGQTTRGRWVANNVSGVSCAWCCELLVVAGLLPRSDTRVIPGSTGLEDSSGGGTVGS